MVIKMSNILTLNKISKIGLSKFTSEYKISDTMENPDAILLRSFNMHDMELPESLQAVARAGAGVNNIPIDACSEKGIVVFNTPGANANAVKELVVAGMFLASRDIIGGANWVQSERMNEDIAKLTEKEKLLLKDLKTAEQLCIDKYTEYMGKATDKKLKNICKK